ncbi:MAG TPA: hypothetical protein VIH99_09545 [Bdellovibrionota bacterium]|jgi:hypothetical protein
MTKRILVFLCIFLGACTSAQQNSKQWKVKATTASQQKIWVTKSDGSRQCAPKKGILTPEKAATQLQGAGVVVFQSRAGSDGQMHAQKCGQPTGTTVDVEISRPDIQRALGLGFVTLETAQE